MGGFANYRHHICNRVFDKEIEKLKQENKKLLECVELIAEHNIFTRDQYEIREIARKTLEEIKELISY